MGNAFEWKVSLHGGHSGEFCDHAEATLEEMLNAAVEAGYHTFGVTEHVPRHEARFLYPKEREMGWTVEKIHADFERYRLRVNELAHAFEGRLNVLRALEMEIVPEEKYVPLMQGFRSLKLADGSPNFDYAVGSVHHLHEIGLDGELGDFQRILELSDGVENTAVLYYAKIAEMVTALRPEVVSHFDLVKLNTMRLGLTKELDSPRVAKFAETALEAVKSVGAILDLNTAGWRKGLGEPYPAPWLVQKAHAMGIGFCFGDDSHRPSHVGAGVPEAREYLLGLGVPTVTVLRREGSIRGGEIVQRRVSL